MSATCRRGYWAGVPCECYQVCRVLGRYWGECDRQLGWNFSGLGSEGQETMYRDLQPAGQAVQVCWGGGDIGGGQGRKKILGVGCEEHGLSSAAEREQPQVPDKVPQLLPKQDRQCPQLYRRPRSCRLFRP